MVNNIANGHDTETVEKLSVLKKTTVVEDGFNILNPYELFGTKMASVVSRSNPVESLMPTEDRAVVTAEEDIFIALGAEWRFRANVQDFYQVQGRCNGRIFAGIFIRKSGDKVVRFAQQYRNGSFSGVIEINQSDFLGYIEFVKKELAMRRLQASSEQYKDFKTDFYYRERRDAIKVYYKVKKDYLGKLQYSEEIDVNCILLDIYDVLGKLPVEYEAYKKENVSPESIYKEVIRIIRKHDYDVCRTFNNIKKSSYYCLDSWDIGFVVDELKNQEIAEFSETEILQLLREGGFLYLTDDSLRYKTAVDTSDGEGNISTERFYCVFKPEFLLEVYKKQV